MQQHSTTNNMICGHINCYSNCEIDYKSNIPLNLQGHFGGLCEKCNHSLWNHHRYRYKWERITDTQVSVKQNMKKWEAAKDGAKKTALLDTIRDQVLSDLDRIVNTATDDLAQLVEQYSRLSLSGSFSVQVDRAVRLLEQRYSWLEGTRVCQEGTRVYQEGTRVYQDQVQKVKDSLDHMVRKLELLNCARAKAQGS